MDSTFSLWHILSNSHRPVTACNTYLVMRLHKTNSSHEIILNNVTKKYFFESGLFIYCFFIQLIKRFQNIIILKINMYKRLYYMHIWISLCIHLIILKKLVWRMYKSIALGILSKKINKRDYFEFNYWLWKSKNM